MVSIKKLLLQNMLLVTFISFAVLYLLWIQNEYTAFKEESAAIKDKFVEKEKERLKSEVQNVLEYVRYMRHQTDKRLRVSIQDRVDEACAVAMNIYTENKDIKSGDEIKKMIRDALRPIRFSRGRGYYFAFNADGVEELFADRPEMEGKDMLEVRGARGEFVVRDMIALLKDHGQGFYSYTWSKPGETRPEHMKIAYVKYFEPYGWGIGTGEYVEDVEKEIQEEVLKRIATLRFENEGYFFGSIFGGRPLFTNGEITRGTETVWGLTDPRGVKIIQEQNKAAKATEGGFVSYSWQKPDSDKPSPKLSYVASIPEWEWIIGAGVYLDTVDESMLLKEKDLYKAFLKQAGLYFMVMAGMSLLVFLWTRHQAHKIQSGIRLFSSFFETASLKETAIDPVDLQFEEFKDIAVFANQMIQKRTEALHALEQSEKKYEAITNSAQDAIFCKDVNRRYTFVNPAMAAFFNCKREDLIGKTPEEVFDPVNAAIVTGVDNRTFSGERVSEIRPLLINGKEFTFHTIQAPLDLVDGRVMSISGIVRDMTEQKDTEKERIRAEYRSIEQEKHALVGRVAGKISHDFNNILGVIMGHSELALMGCKEEGTQKALELIHGQTLRGRNLTRNLIAFARDQEPRQEYIKINEKIELVANLMKKEMEGITLVKEFSSSLPDILADPGMMEHAMVNLLQNSLHALSTRARPLITLRTFCSDDQVCFEIEDNGCGIPKEHLGVIFDPSFTLKGGRDMSGSYGKDIKGTGYGLSNVKKYMDQHRGTVRVRSEFGSGACFTVCLPVIQKNLTENEKEVIRKSGPRTGKTILIVEDEPAIFDVQSRILTGDPCFHTVDIAQNGRTALDLLDRNHYDLVSLDYMLPGNISGMDVYRHIRETDRVLPILFISGNIEFLESIKELKNKDAWVDHLSKPCLNQEYIEGINDLLEKAENN
nr:response regulator [Desulfobacula sp.]